MQLPHVMVSINGATPMYHPFQIGSFRETNQQAGVARWNPPWLHRPVLQELLATFQLAVRLDLFQGALSRTRYGELKQQISGDFIGLTSLK